MKQKHSGTDDGRNVDSIVKMKQPSAWHQYLKEFGESEGWCQCGMLYRAL